MPKQKKSQSRKVSTTPTKIYKYGATPVAAEDRKLIADQVFLAHRYQSTLYQIERDRREAFRRLRRTLDPVLNQYESRMDSIQEEIHGLRKGLKKKAERQDPQQQETLVKIRQLKSERKSLGAEISARNKSVVKVFGPADTYYAKQKELRLKQRAAELGLKSIGPNNGLRREVLNALATEMLESETWSEAWKAKFRIDLSAHKALIEARDNRPCFSATGGGVEEAFTQAKKDAKADPSLKPFVLKGRVKSIQPTKDKGLKVQSVLAGQEKILLVEPLPYKGHRGCELLKVRMKVSDSAHISMVVSYHRPLPKDGIIKHMYVRVKTVGYEPVYEVHFVLESNSFTETLRGKNLVALNLGWRVMPKGVVRVATAWDGKTEMFYNMTYRSKGRFINITDAHKHISNLLASADYHFDAAKDQLISWIKSPSCDETFLNVIRKHFPKHLQTEELKSLPRLTSTIQKWRSHNKVRKLVRGLLAEISTPEEVSKLWKDWVSQRKARGEDLYFHVENVRPVKQDDAWKQTAQSKTRYEYEIFYTFLAQYGIDHPATQTILALEWWVRKDEHLVNWARNLERRFANHRENTYRIWAKELRAKYETIIIEKWDKSVTAETPESEEDTRTPQEEQGNVVRQRVGISILVKCLKEAFGAGLKEVSVTKLNVHTNCGGQPLQKLTSDPMYLCDRCQTMYDQDVNLARQLWLSEQSGSEPNPAPARKPRKPVKMAQPSV